ncbi:hypothetical protein HDU77_004947 [Chytriomyces hyalinus]|nr:hypothetical protein HDU77_004947 [Chytriomyces hyalinus]
MECAFNVTDNRIYTCPVCRRPASSCRLFSATPNALTRAPMIFTEIVRELALLVPRSRSNMLAKQPQKQPQISATTSTAKPITNISYPPSALRLDDCEAASATLKPARMRLGMGKKTGMLLPGHVLLRNKVEFLHKEYSDVAGLHFRTAILIE